jgi:hypothetical protein
MSGRLMERKLTEHDGRQALHDHVVAKALYARDKYGAPIDYAAVCAMLDDREIVRFPTGLRFDADGLEPGEFAHAQPLGEHPAGGYCLFVHPYFEQRLDALPLLIAYHIVTVNYGDIATAGEAELFGATLLGMDVEAYYEAVCRLADELGARG